MNAGQRSGLAIGACALLASVLAAGCSSNSGNGTGGSSTSASSSSGGSTASGSGSKLSGSPVKIGLVDSVQSQAISVPDVPRAAQIAVMRVNADGGIHGRPLQLDVCDGEDNAQQGAECAQQLLVQDNDIMLVGEASATGGATLYPVLKKTNKINFGDYPVDATDATNPLSYPIVPSSFQLATFASVLPKGSGLVDVITYSGYESFVQGLAGPGLEAKGYKVKVIGEPATTVDWSTAASEVKQDGAKYVLLSLAQDKIATVVNALQQAGSQAIIGLVSTAVTGAALKSIAQQNIPTVIAAATTTDPAQSTLYSQYLADIKTYGKSVGIQDTVGQQIINAYAAVILFAQIANKLSTVDSASFQSYLDAQTSFDTGGLTHPIDFAKPGALTGLPRIFNTWNVPADATAAAAGYEVTSQDWLSP